MLNKTLTKYSYNDVINNGTLLAANSQGTYEGKMSPFNGTTTDTYMFLGITGTIAIDGNGNWNPAFSVWGYNQQDVATVFLTVAITNSMPGQGQYVIV